MLMKIYSQNFTKITKQTAHNESLDDFIVVFRNLLDAGLLVERVFRPGVSHYFYQERLVARVEFTETTWSAVYFPLTGGIVFDSTAEELDNLPYPITG